jgi:hypothetical protein
MGRHTSMSAATCRRESVMVRGVKTKLQAIVKMPNCVQLEVSDSSHYNACGRIRSGQGVLADSKHKD